MENRQPLQKRSTLFALFLLGAWVVSPLAIMLLNATHTDTEETYKIWVSFLFAIGGLSYLPGLAFLQEKKYKITSLLPILIFVVFMLWTIISTCLSDFPLLAIFGKVPLSDCLAEYFAFGGLMLAGITIASDKKYCFILTNLFIAIATLLAVISLVNNDLTTLLCVNEKTNTFEYQSVFFNTNHYGYYLTISIIINAYLIEYSKDAKIKLIYSLTFSILVATLIMNNTMGAYLAVFLTLIFAIIWSIINKEKDKQPIYVFSLFIAISLLMQIFGENILGNFASMFTDMFVISDSTSSMEEIQATGSGRLLLWQAALIFIKIHPIFGWGPSNIALSAHNMFLQIAIYSGIIGLIIYLSAFVLGAIRLIKARKTISPYVKSCAFAVVAYLISGFFGLTVFYTAPYFYIVLGICMSECLENTSKEK